MNLSALRTALRTRGGWPTNDAMFTDAVLNDILNAALHEIETQEDWPWLEGVETIATANGTDNYTPAAGWMRTISLTIAGRLPLERRTITQMDELLGTTGEPRYYATFAEKLYVRPVPTGVLNMTHRYLKAETDLAADGDTPLMPVSYHAAIVEKGASIAFRREGRLADAGAADAAYENWKARMLHRANRRSDEPGGGALPPAPAAAVAK